MTDLDRLDALADSALMDAIGPATIRDLIRERGEALRDKATLRDMRDAAAKERDELRAAADAALTDFIYEHGSDFDAAEWPGFAALRAALHREAGT